MDSYFVDQEESFEEESLDLRRYYRVLLKRWWLVLIITIAIAGPWALYLKGQPAVYEAEALIRFKNFAGSDPELAQSRKTELMSRSFAERVVAQLGLSMILLFEEDQMVQRSRLFTDFSTTRNPIPGRYVLRLLEDRSYQLIMQNQDNKEAILMRGEIGDITTKLNAINGFSFKLVDEGWTLPFEIPFKIKAFRNAVKAFQARINVNVDRSGTLMSLSLSDTDPILVASMTNSLAEIFIAESANLKNKGVKGRREIIEEQLNIIQGNLDESDKSLKAFKEKYSTYLNNDENDRVNDVVSLNRTKNKIQETKKTLTDLLAKKAEERAASNGKGLGETERNIMLIVANHSIFDEDATMLTYRLSLRNLEAKWKNIATRLSPENPKAKEFLQQIDQEHVKIEKIARAEIETLGKNLQSTLRELSSAEYRLKQLPTQQYKLAELERNNKVLDRQYLDLLSKFSDAQLTEAVSSEDIEILDTAIVPEFPTNRDKKKKAILGGVFGLMFGLGLVLLIEFMDKSVKTVDDVKRYLKLQVLGTIPQIDFQEVYDLHDSEKVRQIDQQLVTHDYSPTPVGEAYRSLRTNLLFSKGDTRPHSLVITSNAPGDGKSFTAANLAITLAQLRSSTLLVDSDLRRGVLHNTFGVAKDPGFSNYLTTALPLSSLIKETHIPNLSLITCGSLIPNPSELLGSHQMKRFLDEVRRKFELVIFDTPPLNAATDAIVVGTQVDGTLIVIRAGKTERNLAKQKLELFNNVPAKVIGAVLNGTTADMAHPGYSYYHY